jgi:hypothetical protein
MVQRLARSPFKAVPAGGNKRLSCKINDLQSKQHIPGDAKRCPLGATWVQLAVGVKRKCAILCQRVWPSKLAFTSLVFELELDYKIVTIKKTKESFLYFVVVDHS